MSVNVMIKGVLRYFELYFQLFAIGCKVNPILYIAIPTHFLKALLLIG